MLSVPPRSVENDASKGRFLETFDDAATVKREDHLDYCAGLTGSEAAFPALLARAMIEHAVEQGLPSDFARRAAEGVVVNAAQLLTGRDPQKIVDDLSPIAARPPQRSMRWWRSSKPPTPDSLRPHANQRLWHSVECRPVLPKVGTSLHHGHNLGSEKYRGRAAWADPNDHLIAILRGVTGRTTLPAEPLTFHAHRAISWLVGGTMARDTQAGFSGRCLVLYVPRLSIPEDRW